MYAIFYNDRRYGTKRFDSYEAARSHARKLIRKGKFEAKGFDWTALLWRNPTISAYNVSIKAV